MLVGQYTEHLAGTEAPPGECTLPPREVSRAAHVPAVCGPAAEGVPPATGRQLGVCPARRRLHPPTQHARPRADTEVSWLGHGGH